MLSKYYLSIIASFLLPIYSGGVYPDVLNSSDIDPYIRQYGLDTSTKYKRILPSECRSLAASEAYMDYKRRECFPVEFKAFQSSFIKQSEAREQWEQSPYFNTKFLLQYDNVTQQLIADGFTQVRIMTPDNIVLDGLLLERANARCTVIVSVGFFPGRREGMAPIYQLLPEDCNILFFNARGHGKSTGPNIWTSIASYGLNEYQDIVGAAEFLSKRNASVPIILYGTCAGAYHSVRTALELNVESRLDALNIRGIIFDSGWDIPAQAGLAVLRTTKFGSLLQLPGQALYRIYRKLRYGTLENYLRLSDKIHVLPANLKICYMHAAQDQRAPFQHIVPLVANTNNHELHMFMRSKHSDSHLKEKYDYQAALASYINSILPITA